MVNEFKLTVVHFAPPNPMQICACAWIYRWTKKLWKIRTGPPGLRAVGRGAPGRGPAFSKPETDVEVGFFFRNPETSLLTLPMSSGMGNDIDET